MGSPSTICLPDFKSTSFYQITMKLTMRLINWTCITIFFSKLNVLHFPYVYFKRLVGKRKFIELAVMILWWWCLINLFHTKLNQNLIIYWNFKSLGKGCNFWMQTVWIFFPFCLIFNQHSNKDFHIKCHKNQINEYLHI